LLAVPGALVAGKDPWLAYGVLALGVASSYLGLLVGGRVSRIQWRSSDLLSARPVRVVLLNFMMVWWLMIVSTPLALSAEVIVALSFVLVGSGLARPDFIRWFEELPPRRQASLVIPALLISCALLAAAWQFGRVDAFKPWLVAGVFSLVLFRRAIAYGVAINGNRWLAVVVALAGWTVVSVLREKFQLEERPQEYGEPPVLVSGAIFFLAGAIYAFGRAAYDAVRALREKS
jgi:hypothetical protein